MEENRTPQEFLNDLLQITETLEASRKELSDCKEKRAKLDSALDNLKKGIEKEKAQTLKTRRADLESGFDKQLKAIDQEIDAVSARRQKALNEGMKARVKEQTAGYKQASVDCRMMLKNYVKEHRLPMILNTKLYYKLFCPGALGYLLYALLFIAVMFVLILLGHNTIAGGAGVRTLVPHIAIGAGVLVLTAIYIFIWANTRVKYRDEIRHCQDILKNIRTNQKTTKAIEKNIMTAKDDSTYDLHEYDAELEAKNTKRAEINMQKSQAIWQFESQTQQQLVQEIDNAYAEKLAQANADLQAGVQALREASEKVSGAESFINQNYISFVGEKNLKPERIRELIRLVESGDAASVSDAVTRLG